MLKFFLRIAAVAAASLLLLVAASAVMLPAADSAGAYAAMPDGITLACTGNSHSMYAFDFSYFPEETTFSFAMESQSLPYDERMLLHYAGHFAEDAVLLSPPEKPR